VDVAGELRFALDVDNALGADERARRDARGTAECIVAELMDGQTVDLADHLAVEVDDQGAFPDFVLDPVLGEVGTVAFMSDGGVDVGASHERTAFLSRPVACLADEVAHEAEP